MQKLLSLFFILCMVASSAQDIRERDSLFLADLYGKFSDPLYFPSCRDLKNSSDFKIDSTLLSFYKAASYQLSVFQLSPTRLQQFVKNENELSYKIDSLENEIRLQTERKVTGN